MWGEGRALRLRKHRVVLALGSVRFKFLQWLWMATVQLWRVESMSTTKKKRTTWSAAIAALVAMLLVVTACSSGPGGIEPTPEADIESSPEAGTDDAAEVERPDALPAEMPIPDYASYWMTVEPHLLFEAPLPVAEVIEDMERLLIEHGWEVIDQVEEVGWGGDVLFRVIGYGHDMDVYVHPTDGSETETTIMYGPGGEWIG